MIAGVLELNWRDIKALRVQDAYSIHRVVFDLFEDARSEAQKHASVPSGFLYVDKGGDASSRKILFVSDRPPRIPQAGRLLTKSIPDGLLEHDLYAFETVVNPTKRSMSKKLLAVPDDEVPAWFSSKAATNWGFEVLSCEVLRSQWLSFRKTGHAISLKQSCLKGVLRVTDSQKFKESFRRGIGRGRAFGCGLLQIVPINLSNIKSSQE